MGARHSHGTAQCSPPRASHHASSHPSQPQGPHFGPAGAPPGPERSEPYLHPQGQGAAAEATETKNRRLESRASSNFLPAQGLQGSPGGSAGPPDPGRRPPVQEEEAGRGPVEDEVEGTGGGGSNLGLTSRGGSSAPRSARGLRTARPSSVPLGPASAPRGPSSSPPGPPAGSTGLGPARALLLLGDLGPPSPPRGRFREDATSGTSIRGRAPFTEHFSFLSRCRPFQDRANLVQHSQRQPALVATTLCFIALPPAAGSSTVRRAAPWPRTLCTRPSRRCFRPCVCTLSFKMFSSACALRPEASGALGAGPLGALLGLSGAVLGDGAPLTRFVAP